MPTKKIFDCLNGGLKKHHPTTKHLLVDSLFLGIIACFNSDIFTLFYINIPIKLNLLKL